MSLARGIWLTGAFYQFARTGWRSDGESVISFAQVQKLLTWPQREATMWERIKKLEEENKRLADSLLEGQRLAQNLASELNALRNDLSADKQPGPMPPNRRMART